MQPFEVVNDLFTQFGCMNNGTSSVGGGFNSMTAEEIMSTIPVITFRLSDNNET